MTQVKRYNPLYAKLNGWRHTAFMTETVEGEYVTLLDYEVVKQENEKLNDILQKLHDGLTGKGYYRLSEAREQLEQWAFIRKTKGEQK